MTACGFRLFLFVLLSVTDLSEEGCGDYFSLKNRGQYANHIVSVINTTDPKDIWECTVEKACIDAVNEKCKESVMSNCTEIKKNIPYCNWLVHCYDRADPPDEVTEKCKGEVSQTLNGYHLVCLTAIRLNFHPEVPGCDYYRVYDLYKEILRIVSDETTKTKTTLPETTTTAAPTTTLPGTTRATTTTPTTPTTTTTLPDTTRATTTPPPPTTTTTTTTTTTAPPTTTTTLPGTTRATTTAPPPTTTTTTAATATTTTALSPTVARSAVSGNNAAPSNSLPMTEDNKDTNTDPFQVLFGISVIFNVIVALIVLYMHRRWTQDRRQWVNILALETNGHLPEAQLMTELRSDTPPPPSANREEEITQLMTPQECQSIVTHSADTDRHCRAAGEDTPL